MKSKLKLFSDHRAMPFGPDRVCARPELWVASSAVDSRSSGELCLRPGLVIGKPGSTNQHGYLRPALSAFANRAFTPRPILEGQASSLFSQAATFYGGNRHDWRVHNEDAAIAPIVQQLKDAKSDSEVEKLKGQLDEALEKSFAMRQKRHTQEIEELEAKVKTLKELVGKTAGETPGDRRQSTRSDPARCPGARLVSQGTAEGLPSSRIPGSRPATTFWFSEPGI